MSDKVDEENVGEVDELDETWKTSNWMARLSCSSISLEVLFNEHKPDHIDEDEAAIISSLVRRILKYNPLVRPSAAELL